MVCSKKRGTAILSETVLGSVVVIGAIVIIFMVLRSIMCKTGTWSGGIC
ncbi:hypothetical protein HYU17_00620 [Candidatus Woesearchaeota archaeon]|nr:hypothetical protein [Candidatus Woesearchaeota archaeon]